MARKLIFATLAAGIVFCCGFFVGKYVEQQKCPARAEHCRECEKLESERIAKTNSNEKSIEEVKKNTEELDAMLKEVREAMEELRNPDASAVEGDGGV